MYECDCCDKHHDQKQTEEERVDSAYTPNHSPSLREAKDRKLEAETEAESKGGGARVQTAPRFQELLTQSNRKLRLYPSYSPCNQKRKEN